MTQTAPATHCSPSLSDDEREILSVIGGYEVEDVDELQSTLVEDDDEKVQTMLEGLMFDGYVREGPYVLELTEKGEVALYGPETWGRV